MNVNQLKESKYLKKEDCGAGILVTIRALSQDNVAKDGAEPEMKWIMHFTESEKGMVLNSTNGQLAAAALKSEETDDWIGKQIVLYHDPNVSYAGKLIGGIRVRAPRIKAVAPVPQRLPLVAKPEPAPEPSDNDGANAIDDEVPF